MYCSLMLMYCSFVLVPNCSAKLQYTYVKLLYNKTKMQHYNTADDDAEAATSACPCYNDERKPKRGERASSSVAPLLSSSRSAEYSTQSSSPPPTPLPSVHSQRVLRLESKSTIGVEFATCTLQGEDRCLDQIRGKLGKLAIFWTFQVIWAWTVSLPVTIVNASNHNPSVREVDIIGWVVWLLGILCEAVADQQKLSFKNSPRNKGMWCNVGLWKYSRHPNYFGESRGSLKLILLWWGSFMAATPALIGAEWLVIFGPNFSTLLLLFATGIPFLEDSLDKKYGNVYDYRQYKRVTRTNQLQDASEQKMD
ncbi:hypothetical protein Drorol1_Dr00021045 [Drosera rotundifolia]